MNKYLKVIVFNLLIFFGLINFSSADENEVNPSIQYDEIYDPIEPVNRAMLEFNFVIDDVVIRPVIKTYKFIAPDPVEKGVSNFFGNLREPIRAIAFVFQGEFIKSINSFTSENCSPRKSNSSKLGLFLL